MDIDDLALGENPMSASSGMSQEIVRLAGSELLTLLKTGQVSACDVLESHIQRIEHVNPQLNALVVPLFDHARKEAERLDSAYARGEELGPLHGIPITVKESIEMA